MILDFNEYDGEALQADVAIVGAGAAGITIAREFIDSGHSVLLIESGGLQYEQPTQSLYDMVNVGLPRVPEAVSRVRYFGGSTNLWAGRCAALDEIDMAVRDWVPHSGWPISLKDLASYYDRAGQVLGLGPQIYDDRLYKMLGEARPVPFDSDKLKTRFWQFSTNPTHDGSPTRFGSDYRLEIERARDIRVLLHCNLVNIATTLGGSSVTALDVRSLTGKQAKVQAKYFVLASGGIENARLLLLSIDAGAAGLGNRYDQVGRYFMEHPRGRCGVAVGGDLTALQERCRHHWYDAADGARHVYLSGIGISDSLQKSRRILNCDVSLVETEKPDSGTRAMERLIKSTSSSSLDDIWRVVTDLDDVVRNTSRRFVEHKPPIIEASSIALECHIEQAPNPVSRVTLAHEKDALGLPKSKMDWRLTQFEQRSIETFATTLAAELARMQMARVKLDSWVLARGSEWADGVQDVAHHMGTTRMSANPREGVVDSDCKVHGLQNLFIAGSSVFPTSGCVNPTLTITALSLRLADKIKTALDTNV